MRKIEKSKFYGLCLQGKIHKAIAYLESLQPQTEEVKDLKTKYTRRFLLRQEEVIPKTDDPWIEIVLSSYRNYYLAVLTGYDVKLAEERLIAELSSCLAGSIYYAIDAIEKELKYKFQEKGYSFLGGDTSPFYGPYIWKHTEQKSYQVKIPDGVQKVNVFYISDFLMISWAYFATFGVVYAGGWAKEEGLYYVVREDTAIDDTSVDFVTCFLKHEAQHLYDFKHNPSLKGYQLEYRAKLVELIYYPNNKNLLEKFHFEAANDSALPHSYASHLIMEEYIKKLNILNPMNWWQYFEESVLRQIAVELFKESLNTLTVSTSDM